MSSLYFKKEFDVSTFEFWGPAKDVVKNLRAENMIELLQEIIEDSFCGKTPTVVEINDFVSYVVPEEFKETFNIEI